MGHLGHSTDTDKNIYSVHPAVLRTVGAMSDALELLLLLLLLSLLLLLLFIIFNGFHIALFCIVIEPVTMLITKYS